MTGRLVDWCAELVPAPNTGTITLPGTAVAGGRSFSSSFSNGDTVYYTLVAPSGQIEVGIGTYSTSGGNFLARTTILWNTAGSTSPLAIITTATLFCDIPAQRDFYLDDHLLVPQDQTGPYLVDNIQISPSKTVTTFPGAVWTPIGFDAIVTSGLGTLTGSTNQTTFVIPSDGYYFLRWQFGLQITAGTPLDLSAAIFADTEMLVRGQSFLDLPTGVAIWYDSLDWLGLLTAGQVVTANASGNFAAGPQVGRPAIGQALDTWFAYGQPHAGAGFNSGQPSFQMTKISS